jgi:pimeloyl-ACP methyl ester carboxylesterase
MLLERQMSATVQTLDVVRGPHRLHVEVTAGSGPAVVLMHGFPDNIHLYDRLVPYLEGRQLVRFDFLGWGRSDKPIGYPYTADNQTKDLAAVIESLPSDMNARQLVLVAHDASGPPAIDWALAHPSRVSMLVLLNTYYHWTPGLRRPPAIALYSTPLVRDAARAAARRWPELDRRLYRWQVGRFIHDAELRDQMVPQLYQDFVPAREAFWRLNDDLIGTVLSRRRRAGAMRTFTPPVRIIFGAEDRYLNPGVALKFAELFPNSELHLIPRAGHYVQVDEPERVAHIIADGVPS